MCLWWLVPWCLFLPANIASWLLFDYRGLEFIVVFLSKCIRFWCLNWFQHMIAQLITCKRNENLEDNLFVGWPHNSCSEMQSGREAVEKKCLIRIKGLSRTNELRPIRTFIVPINFPLRILHVRPIDNAPHINLHNLHKRTNASRFISSTSS